MVKKINEDFKGDLSSSSSLSRQAPASDSVSGSILASSPASTLAPDGGSCLAVGEATTSSEKNYDKKFNRPTSKSLIPTLDTLRKTSSLSMNVGTNLARVSVSTGNGSQTSLLEEARPKRGLARSFSMLAMIYSGRISGSSEQCSLVGVVSKDASRQITKITQHLFPKKQRTNALMLRRSSELNVNLAANSINCNRDQSRGAVEKRANSMLCLSKNRQDEGQPVELRDTIDKTQLSSSETSPIKVRNLNDDNAEKKDQPPVQVARQRAEEEGEVVKKQYKDKKKQQSNRSRIFTSSLQNSVLIEKNKESKQKQANNNNNKLATKSLTNNGSNSNSSNKNAKTNLSKQFNKNHISLLKQNGLISSNKSASINNKLPAENRATKQQQTNRIKEQDQKEDSTTKGFWQLR